MKAVYNREMWPRRPLHNNVPHLSQPSQGRRPRWSGGVAIRLLWPSPERTQRDKSVPGDYTVNETLPSPLYSKIVRSHGWPVRDERGYALTHLETLENMRVFELASSLNACGNADGVDEQRWPFYPRLEFTSFTVDFGHAGP